MLRIDLPFPPPGLMPNRKNGKHWTATYAEKGAAWNDAFILTSHAVRSHTGPWYPLTGKVPVTLTFCAPDKRHRDLDNLLAACKSMLDAVATALTINDRQFDPITVKRGETCKGGAVVLEVGA